MTKLTFAAAALIAFSALAASAPAKADNLQGGPLSQNGQCFKYSVGNDKDARFGSWNACVDR